MLVLYMIDCMRLAPSVLNYLFILIVWSFVVEVAYLNYTYVYKLYVNCII